MRQPYETVVAQERAGIYESHDLEATSPDGRQGFRIEHTLLRPIDGDDQLELWFVWFERGARPRVCRMDVPWERLRLGPGPHIDAGRARLERREADGELGGVSWNLHMEGGGAPLYHLGREPLYHTGFPSKKVLTPAPGLRFTGTVRLDGSAVELRDWVGLRGHSWGAQHPHSYAHGSCNLWDDGVERTVDGFTARYRIGGRPSPPMSTLVVRAPEGKRELTSPRQWLRHGTIEPTAWHIRRPRTHLVMRCEPTDLVGLRYRQPGGGERYSYSTRFARVSLRLGSALLRSGRGSLETLFPTPLPQVPLHPPASWTARDGVYDSGATVRRS